MNSFNAFKEYKMLHHFLHRFPLKSWVNQANYSNTYKEDWNALMELVETIESKGYGVVIDCNTVTIPLAKIRIYDPSKKCALYKACVEFVKQF